MNERLISSYLKDDFCVAQGTDFDLLLTDI